MIRYNYNIIMEYEFDDHYRMYMGTKPLERVTEWIQTEGSMHDI